MNKMFSTLVVETKDNKPLSKYMNKSIKDIKSHDDFKSIFSKEGIQTYTKEKLKNINTKKGTNFRDINCITVINSPSSTDGAHVITK